MAGTELRFLAGEGHALVREAGWHGVPAMTVDYAELCRRQRFGGVDDMAQQGFAGERVKDFRQRGLHALSHAGGEDDDVHEWRSKK